MTSKRIVRFPPNFARGILLSPSTHRSVYNTKLKNLNKHNLNKFVSAVQYREWTVYGGVLETSAKDATACDSLQRRRWKAKADCIEHSHVTAINHY